MIFDGEQRKTRHTKSEMETNIHMFYYKPDI